jgi:hypothetical protein
MREIFMGRKQEISARVRELRVEYKAALKSRQKCLSRDMYERAERRIAGILAEIEILDVELRTVTGGRKRAGLKTHSWSEEDVMIAFVIFKVHGITAAAIAVAHELGDSLGMGGDSMWMKVAAFYANSKGESNWTLCGTGKAILEEHGQCSAEEANNLAKLAA